MMARWLCTLTCRCASSCYANKLCTHSSGALHTHLLPCKCTPSPRALHTHLQQCKRALRPQALHTQLWSFARSPPVVQVHAQPCSFAQAALAPCTLICHCANSCFWTCSRSVHGTRTLPSSCASSHCARELCTCTTTALHVHLELCKLTLCPGASHTQLYSITHSSPVVHGLRAVHAHSPLPVQTDASPQSFAPSSLARSPAAVHAHAEPWSFARSLQAVPPPTAMHAHVAHAVPPQPSARALCTLIAHSPRSPQICTCTSLHLCTLGARPESLARQLPALHAHYLPCTLRASCARSLQSLRSPSPREPCTLTASFARSPPGVHAP